ncbi:MAG: helix-turn-helix transcriptional regulator [Pseudomonadota bacterium]
MRSFGDQSQVSAGAVSSTIPASSVNEVMGQRLRFRRRHLGYTLATLSEEVGVSTQQLHKYESGVNGIRATVLLKISSVLNVPVSWFFEGLQPEADMPDDLLDLTSDPDNGELLLLFSKLKNPTVKSGILKMVRHFADEENAAEETTTADTTNGETTACEIHLQQRRA